MLLIASIFGIGYLNNYYSSYDYSLRKRAEIAGQNHPDIHVAVVWDLLHDNGFTDGVKLAFKEVNEKGVTLKSNHGTTRGQIFLHEYDDGSEKKAESARQAVANNHEIVAVLGHSKPASAISASISYEYNGVLFISPMVTDPSLTDHKFKYTFSTNPSNKSYIKHLVDYARQHKLFKFIILYIRGDYGMNLYQELGSQLDDDFEIVASRSFFPLQEDIAAGNMNRKTDIIFQLMQNSFDAVFLIARDGMAAEMIQQLRSMGISQPILGSEGLDYQDIWNKSGHHSNNTFVASVYPGGDAAAQKSANNPHIAPFIEKFKASYGYEPNYSAFQGYDAAMVLASAFELTGTTVPIRVGATLTYKYQEEGYNHYKFDLNGLITNKKIFIKEMIGDQSKIIDSESSQ